MAPPDPGTSPATDAAAPWAATSADEQGLPAPPVAEELWLTDRVLSVRRVGQGGTPTVLLHGLGGSSLNWTDLSLQLSGRLDTWAVDLPGFGASPPPRDGDYTQSGHAKAVYELITQRIGRPVHVFGNSMGGAVALQLAARAPSWVRSLTLISPAFPGGRITRTNMHVPVIAVPGVGERLIARYLRAPADLRARATIMACYGDTDRLHPQRLAEAVTEVRERDAVPYASDAFAQSARGLVRSMLDRGPNRPSLLMTRVGCPVLLIYGRKDQLVDPAGAFRVGNTFPDARVVVLPDSGHVAQMEHPDEVALLWRDLIDTRRATGS